MEIKRARNSQEFEDSEENDFEPYSDDNTPLAKQTKFDKSEGSEEEDISTQDVICEFVSEVHDLLAKIGECGNIYATSGQLGNAPNMLISLENGELMRFPMYEDDTETIIKAMGRSPYVKDSSGTMLDFISNACHLDPSVFKIMNMQWEVYMKEVLIPRLGKEMFIDPTTFTASLYSMLLLTKGSFYKVDREVVHCEAERKEGIFATLMVQLPCKYSGCQLVIEHDGNMHTIDFCSTAEENKEFDTFFVAFLNDCEVGILPLTSGTRICLIYNLTMTRNDVTIPVAPRLKEQEERLSLLLKNWPNSVGLPKIVYHLNHQSTRDDVSLDNLESSGRAIINSLLNLSKRIDLVVFLGIFDKESAGDLGLDNEESSYCVRKYTLNDLKVLSVPNKKIPEFTTLKTVDYNEEVIPKNCFDTAEPYKVITRPRDGKDTEEAVYAELHYCGAAAVFFPSINIINILVDEDREKDAERIFLEEFERIGRTERGRAQLKRCATIMCEKSRLILNHRAFSAMLTAIASFNDLELLKNFLDKHTYMTKSTFPIIIQECERFGWMSLSTQISNMLRMSTLGNPKTMLTFIDSFIDEGELSEEKKIVCQQLVKEVLNLTEKITTVYSVRVRDEKLEAEQNFLYDLCNIAKKINFDVFEHVKDKSFHVFGPVLLKLCNDCDKVLDAHWIRIGQFFVDKMQKITEKNAIEPTWTITSYGTCGCVDCSIVECFLDSENISIRLQMGDKRMYHIQNKLKSLRNVELDVGGHVMVITKLSKANSEMAELYAIAEELLPKLKSILLKVHKL